MLTENEVWIRFACAALAGGQDPERDAETEAQVAGDVANAMLDRYLKIYDSLPCIGEEEEWKEARAKDEMPPEHKVRLYRSQICLPNRQTCTQPATDTSYVDGHRNSLAS